MFLNISFSARGQPRACEPQPTIYTIPHQPISERYIPDCLNVTRCGGCCTSSLTNSPMECVANETKTNTVKVVFVDKFSKFDFVIFRNVYLKIC